jgi:hypothetical protein
MYFGSTTVIAYSLQFWVLRLIASNAVTSVYSLLQNFCKENLRHKMCLLSVYEL